MLEQLSRLFHAANRQFGGLGELGGLLGGQLSSNHLNMKIAYYGQNDSFNERVTYISGCAFTCVCLLPRFV